jgi:hypothetical protein
MKPKTNGTFKLSKSSKRILATKTGQDAVDFKHQMIDAEVSYAKAKLAKPPKNNKPDLG